MSATGFRYCAPRKVLITCHRSSPNRLLSCWINCVSIIISSSLMCRGFARRSIVCSWMPRTNVCLSWMAHSHRSVMHCAFWQLPAGPAQSRPPIVVLNHVGCSGMLPRKQVIAALDQTPEVIIPHAPKLLAHAATIGAPATRSGKGPLHAAMEQLARQITVTATLPKAQEGRGYIARSVRTIMLSPRVSAVAVR